MHRTPFYNTCYNTCQYSVHHSTIYNAPLSATGRQNTCYCYVAVGRTRGTVAVATPHHWRIFWGGGGGVRGCAHPPTSFVHPQHVLHPPNIYSHPTNIFAPYPRNYSIRGQAAYVPPNYSFLQLQITPVLTFLMLSGTF